MRRYGLSALRIDRLWEATLGLRVAWLRIRGLAALRVARLALGGEALLRSLRETTLGLRVALLRGLRIR